MITLTKTNCQDPKTNSFTAEDFFDIWLTEYSHAHITWKEGYSSWKTASSPIKSKKMEEKLFIFRGREGKRAAIPTSRDVFVKEFYKTDRSFGKRFHRKANYVLCDIDYKEGDKISDYHPLKSPENFLQLQIDLEEIGLKDFILNSSSDRGEGIHLVYPLAESVWCSTLATKVHDHLKSKGYNIGKGQLEIFPNKNPNWKNTLYNGHRIPLQPESGSYILDPQTLEPISNDLGYYAQLWHEKKNNNSFSYGYAVDSIPTEIITEAPKFPDQIWGDKEAPGRITQDIGLMARWNNLFITGPSQTNDRLLELARILHEAGLTCEDALEAHIYFGEQIPGFEEYASDASKKDFANTWSDRIINTWYGKVNLVVNPIRKSLGENLNHAREQSACDRITQAVKSAIDNGIQGISRLSDYIQDYTKRIFGVKTSKTTLYKHKDLWHPEESTVFCTLQNSMDNLYVPMDSGSSIPLNEDIEESAEQEISQPIKIKIGSAWVGKALHLEEREDGTIVLVKNSAKLIKNYIKTVLRC